MRPKSLAFSRAEYRDRLQRAQAALAASGCDALLLHNLASICYLTGFESLAVHKFWVCIVLPTGDPILLVQDFESHNAQYGCWVTNLHTFGVAERPLPVLVRLLQKLRLDRKRLGIELGFLSTLNAQGYVWLVEQLPRAKFVDATPVVPRLRAIKSVAEIGYLRDAGALTSAAMQHAIEAVAVGKTDNDVAAVASETLIRLGSEYQCYQPIVTVGRRSGIPHSTFQRRRIGPGDAVFMEFGACLRRYSAPQLRTAVAGAASPKLRRLFEMCRRSVEASLAAMRPGVTGDAVARAAAEAMGPLPRGWVWHGIHGYSIGLGFPPEWADCLEVEISLGSEAVLQPGMTFHCSTSIRDPGKVGATCSETVLITKHGCETFTSLPRELFIR